MTACVVAVNQGGVLVLALDTTRTDLSTCPYTVADGSSNAWQELGNMSLDNAAQIGMSVGLVWATCWTFRILRRAINIDKDKDSE